MRSTIEPEWKFVLNRQGEQRLILKGQVTQDLLDGIKGKTIASVVLSYGTWDDLSCLLEHRDSIREVMIRGDHVDWESISKLRGLVLLEQASSAGVQIDFSRLKKLRHLQAYWDRAFEASVPSLRSLECFRLYDYPMADLQWFGKGKGAKFLELIDTRKLLSTAGVHRIKGLKGMACVRSPKLSEVIDIDKAKAMRSLWLETCNRIENVAGIAAAKQLEGLLLTTKKVDSLKPLQSLTKLRHLAFECHVSDGDLAFLFDMRALRWCSFRTSRNFNVKSKDVSEYLENKGFDQATLRLERWRFRFPDFLSGEV